MRERDRGKSFADLMVAKGDFCVDGVRINGTHALRKEWCKLPKNRLTKVLRALRGEKVTGIREDDMALAMKTAPYYLLFLANVS